MATSTFPSITPNATELGILFNTKTFTSPLSGYTQTVSREGARWFLRMTFNDLQGADRSILRAFLAEMEGQVNRAEITDHAYTGARGALGGTPLVKGVDQTGSSLITDGWPNSTLVLKAGDLFSYDNGTNKELKMVTADGTSDGSGNLTLSIAPEIHTSPANNATITVVDPVGTFMLATPAVRWTNVPSQVAGSASPASDFSIEGVEDIA